MATVHWVRHGETEWNRARRIQGQTDSPLTERGRAEAAAAAEALRGRPIAKLYTSDLGRARATAEAVGRAVDLVPETDPRLRELHYGTLEGLSWSQVEQAHPEAYQTLRGGPVDRQLPGGESRQQMIDRAFAFLEDVGGRHPSAEIVVVSHGGVIAYVLRTVLGIPYGSRPAFRTPNCSISTFALEPTGWRLCTWGRVDHLEGLKPDA